MKLSEIEQAKELYISDKLSFDKVGSIIGYSGKLIRKNLLKIGVKPRHRMEHFKGQHLPEEQKLKISKAITGQKRSLETRRRISESHKGLYDGDKNPAWKGGRRFINGYIWLYKPGYPRARNNLIQEHIWVWEQVHNRSLPQGWVVHHLNGIKIDNRPENLVALPDRKHKHVLASSAQRVRELETKVKLLEKALDDSQMIFNIGEN